MLGRITMDSVLIHAASSQMEASVGFFDDTAFASDALGEVLIRAGAWAPAQPDPGAKKETARSSLPFSRSPQQGLRMERLPRLARLPERATT